jgi:RNA polymerase sigma factor (sigma-70 family)
MATAAGRTNGVLDMLQRLAPRKGLAEHGDAELLGRFLAEGDAAAFEALVRRHGPMVLGVCRRVLRNEADAEDAFQATFLVLATKAGSVAPRSLVGHWLYGVACKTARKAKAMSDRRRSKEGRAARPETAEPAPEGWADLLDEELSRLPEKYRAPVVLCELQGKTIRQAAELVGCPQGTLASRLARGRNLLAEKLRRRGLTLTGAALAALLAGGSASAAVPAALVASTARAASLLAAGEALPAGVAALTEGVLKMMLLNRLRSVVALLVLVALAGGAGLLSVVAAGGRPEKAGAAPRPPLPAAAPAASKRVAAAAPKPLSGREELAALARGWADRARRYVAATEKETSPEKLNEAARRLLPGYDPREVERFFELEKRHRGKDAGLFALNFIVMRAAQVGTPDTAVVKGRDRALKVLRAHYLAHEDLDVVMPSLRWGPLLLGGEEFLKAAAEKSPHEHVRAAALYHWAELLQQQAAVKTARKGLPPLKATATPAERLDREQDLETLRRLKSLDEQEAQKRAALLAKRVLAEYPKAAAPLRVAGPDDPFMPTRVKERKLKAPSNIDIVWMGKPPSKPPRAPTYAELAEGLLFDLTQLAVGQQAPAVEGRDIDGKEFRLGDCKGKVVVLMFSANWCGPCKQLYPALRELQKKFEGKPLEVVTVMADSEQAAVRQAVARGEITWRAVWDGDRGPIARRWNVRRFPTLYVLDRRGVIRSRDEPAGGLAAQVADLLK